MKLKARNILIGLLILIVVIYTTIKVIDTSLNPKRVSYMLNIPTQPKSLRVIECKSGPITDVVITCAVEIDPNEFPLLLKGYTYTESSFEGTSHTIGAVPKLGYEFPISKQYIAHPTGFVAGGAVTIFADKENKHAVVSLYIE
jgi:hypothetical protein